MEKVELLPCPFCNGAAVISVSVGGYLFGECTSDECGAGAWCDTEAEAIAAWNARADADRIEALTAENERLREALAKITDRRWDTMTQGCDAACEAAHLARATLGDTQ